MKRLVLCLDGTWNRADQQANGVPCPTNVVQLAIRVAKRRDGVVQCLYYDQGVGTGNLLDRLSGGAFGEGLEDNIFDAYRFLIGNYEPGDQIFLFGFSRGAFTARSLAGMTRKCGILRRDAVLQYRAALDRYRDGDHPDDPGPIEFRGKYAIGGADPVPIRFIGVWDTVGALGIPLRGLRWITRRRHQFHDTELSGSVEVACHALAIDERRGPFEPTLWTYLPKRGQTVEQVWFCGAHSDVGGGYADSRLSDIALAWMLGKAQAAGIDLDPLVMETADLALHPDHHAAPHDSSRGLYRLVPGQDRVIGRIMAREGTGPVTPPRLDPTQRLHQSVLQRWDEHSDYRPRSLVEYFRLVGDPRASGRERAAMTPAD